MWLEIQRMNDICDPWCGIKGLKAQLDTILQIWFLYTSFKLWEINDQKQSEFFPGNFQTYKQVEIDLQKPDFWLQKKTRQVSSMIHSARPTVSPVVKIVFTGNLFCFLLYFEKDGRTDGQTTCAKTIIPTGRDFGLAEWINIIFCTIFANVLHDFTRLIKYEACNMSSSYLYWSWKKWTLVFCLH